MTEENKNKEQTEAAGQTWMPVVLGGVAGAGVGLLASPETAKKVAGRLGQSEMVRTAGYEFKRTAQDILMEQAMTTIRRSAAGYFEKYENKLLGQNQGHGQIEQAPETKGITDTKETMDSNENNYEEKYNELKEENKNLHQNLERIEEKLNALLDAKG